MIMEKLSKTDVFTMRQVCKPWRNAIDKYFEEEHFLSIGKNHCNDFAFEMKLPQDEENRKQVEDVCCAGPLAQIFSSKLLLRVTGTQLLPCSIFCREDFIPVLAKITQLEIQHGTGSDCMKGKQQRQNIAVHSSGDFYKSVFENLINLKELRVDIITDSMTAGLLQCEKMLGSLRGIQIDAKVDDRDLLNDRMILARQCESLQYYASVGNFNMQKLTVEFVNQNLQYLKHFSVLKGCASEVLEVMENVQLPSLERLRVSCCCDVFCFANKLVRVCSRHLLLSHVEVHLVTNVNTQQQRKKVKCPAEASGLVTIDILCYHLNYNFGFLAGLCQLKQVVLRYYSGKTFQNSLQVLLSTESALDSSLWQVLPSLETLEIKVYLNDASAVDTVQMNCKTVTCTRSMYEKSLDSGEILGTPSWIKYCVYGQLESQAEPEISSDDPESDSSLTDSSSDFDLDYD